MSFKIKEFYPKYGEKKHSEEAFNQWKWTWYEQKFWLPNNDMRLSDNIKLAPSYDSDNAPLYSSFSQGQIYNPKPLPDVMQISAIDH